MEKILMIREKSLPIGTLTSQLFSNCFLNELDHFLKDRKRIKFYCRYADDFVIVSKSKEFLNLLKTLIENFLIENLNLELNKKLQSFQLSMELIFVDLDHLELIRKQEKEFLKLLK